MGHGVSGREVPELSLRRADTPDGEREGVRSPERLLRSLGQGPRIEALLKTQSVHLGGMRRVEAGSAGEGTERLACGKEPPPPSLPSLSPPAPS